jgi:hypothetical protein
MSIKMEIQGVAELNKKLEQLMGNKMPGLKVGVLENAKDPEGEPIAPRAFANEFGATINHPASKRRLIFREKGEKDKGGGKYRFARNNDKRALFGMEVDVAGYTTTIPPRPAFRLTVEEKSGEWVNGLVAKLKDGNIFDEAKVEAAVKKLAETMKSDLMRKIKSGIAPASAESTVRRKQSLGKKVPHLTLVEDGDYQKSIDYEIIPAGQKK